MLSNLNEDVLPAIEMQIIKKKKKSDILKILIWSTLNYISS